MCLQMLARTVAEKNLSKISLCEHRFSRKSTSHTKDDSEDIFKSNIIEHYSNRPREILCVNNLCLAEFAVFYYKDYRVTSDDISDSQPCVLTDTVAEEQHTCASLPDKIKLLNTNEVMKYRKVSAVIRFHTPSKRKEPEKFFHHLLMLYFPWRNEFEDLIGEDQMYASKFHEPEVQTIVEKNREKFEPDAEAVEEALEFVRSNNPPILNSFDSLNDQENADLYNELQDN